MLKLIYLLFVFCWVAQADKVSQVKPTKSPIIPYSMYDQAAKKLENLKEVLSGAVSTATTQIRSEKASYSNYADGVAAQTKLEIEDEANKINGQITVIKNLATTANTDISSCLSLQPKLDNLSVKVLNNFEKCIVAAGREEDDYTTRAFDRIGATEDDVRDLETQLRDCATQSVSCLFPIVNKIDIDMIELPELIEGEVNKCGVFIKTLTPQIGQCSSEGITTYVTQANDILGRIEQCADSLLMK